MTMEPMRASAEQSVSVATAIKWTGAIAAAAERRWSIPSVRDPRIPFALILTLYAVLGSTHLHFNRSPGQMALTVVAACLLDMALAYLLRGRQLILPLSAFITGLSLALLLNYSHNYYLLFLPVYLAIGSKYFFTYEGRHGYNPSMFGIAVSLLMGGDLISTAPAYQWGGSWAMSAFILTAALSLFVFKIGRSALIVSFLGLYLLQILLRAYIMRWYLPPQALIFGTLTSAPFFLFVFYMITDPQTSPSTMKGQVWLALALVLVDLYFHRLTSLYTFFYAAFIVATAKYLYLHLKRLWLNGLWATLQHALLDRQSLWALVIVAAIGLAMVASYRFLIRPAVAVEHLNFNLEPIPAPYSGLVSSFNPEILRQVDTRVQHVAKWLLSAGDMVAAGDYDNDGMLDLFLTNPLKAEAYRNGLYQNLGNFKFRRVEIPALTRISRDPGKFGLVSGVLFADYDNDGDQDLLLMISYGKIILLRNLLEETGKPAFEDITQQAGIDEHTISIAATFFDFDRDGKLDLFIANALNPYLDQYRPPRLLTIFHLPEPEYPGDRRMLPFMHHSWDNAKNGGLNVLYRNVGNGRFEKMDIKALGMPETHWSLAVGAGDLNNDGWTDLYVANDFGPDDLYLNEHGKRFRRIQGRFFGSVGRDSYKGMNVSLGDIDRNGYLDIYVSNVHVPLQAEGSLLWMTYPSKGDPFVPRFRDEAWQRGALNEHRFGWGGALGDLNNDGWLDIIQTNGMVDDTLDKRFPNCPSYWYVNEKLMRSGPEIHTYADMWGDLRGYCINGRESNRIYLSRGGKKRLQFVDIAPQVGWREESPSRGALMADLNNDGALDVAITHLYAPLSLYRNTLYDARRPSGSSSGQPHWIGFRLEGNGTTCNRDAVGSRIIVSYREHDKPVKQMREIHIVNGFAAQGDRRAHFGLEKHADKVDVTISWCGAPPVSAGSFSIDRYHTIRQPKP
ncbi:MAG: FG-GAP-like repeat-containing protein [Candidatus Binatia bacterium]